MGLDTRWHNYVSILCLENGPPLLQKWQPDSTHVSDLGHSCRVWAFNIYSPLIARLAIPSSALCPYPMSLLAPPVALVLLVVLPWKHNKENIAFMMHLVQTYEWNHLFVPICQMASHPCCSMSHPLSRCVGSSWGWQHNTMQNHKTTCRISARDQPSPARLDVSNSISLRVVYPSGKSVRVRCPPRKMSVRVVRSLSALPTRAGPLRLHFVNPPSPPQCRRHLSMAPNLAISV